ncbi:uncharacterized protein [Diabrotica undecimpunctata]|uniref:uncharacterized protein n=1 Tax=Diabrotica undecimpunctata TaxID=50387 RepID=UPI003B632A95
MTMPNLIAIIKIQAETSRTFEIKDGLGQFDALACLLFNIALVNAFRDRRIRWGGTIYIRSIQILAYADDIDIIGHNKRDIEQYLVALQTAAKQVDLVLNEDKTKYMVVTKDFIAN